MTDIERRKRIVEFFWSKGGALGSRTDRRGVTDNYTRVSSRKRFLEWPEDEEPLSEDVRRAVELKLAAIHREAEAVFPEFRRLMMIEQAR